MNEYLAAMRGEHVRDNLGVGGPLHHLQHDRATREEEVCETGALSAVDLGGGDPVGSKVQYSHSVIEYSTCMRRWCGGAPPPRCPAACTWTPGTVIRVPQLRLDTTIL